MDVSKLIGDMKEVYVDAIEDLPPNAPEPRGESLQINCLVDADHDGDKITRRSQTGIILFGNSAPLIWYSKGKIRLSHPLLEPNLLHSR